MNRVKTYCKIAWALRTFNVLLQDIVYYKCQVAMLQNIKVSLAYQPETADCDNFAFIYKGAADRFGNSVGIVYGMYNHKLHVWNMALTVDGIYQVEPQNNYIFKSDRAYKPMVVLI